MKAIGKYIIIKKIEEQVTNKGSGNTVMINNEQYTIILEKNVVVVV